jgi:ubiquinone/menaquinone biosynthesis C-methylase UbiE
VDTPLIEWHRHFVADQAAQEAFRRAIARAVSPGAVVLDLGTGTGLHALFACAAGARRVYAVDREPIVELARALARAHGVEDRIEFIQAPAEEVELPERVDLIVAHHGVEALVALVPRAARRFLKLGGRVIPERAELVAAAVHAPDVYERGAGGWVARYGIDFEAARRMAVNTVYPWLGRPENLLGGGVSLGAVAFTESAPRLAADVTLPIERSGELHGVGTWLVETLVEGEVLSTAPPTNLSREVWRDYFFPIAEPVVVEAGDRVHFIVETGAGGWGRLWRWQVEVRRRAGALAARSMHTSLAGAPLSPAAVRRQALDAVPSLAPRGEIARFVLEQVDGRSTVRQIERAVADRFGDQFDSVEDACAFVSQVLARYAR